ncbi:unnamed protein product [Caretta caretta]
MGDVVLDSPESGSDAGLGEDAPGSERARGAAALPGSCGAVGSSPGAGEEFLCLPALGMRRSGGWGEPRMRRGRAVPLLLPGAGGRAEQRVCAGETFVNSPCPARALLPLEPPRAAELQPPDTGDFRGGGCIFHQGRGGSAGPHSESPLQGCHAGEL